ncbi:ATP-dependent DNA helicase MER3-like [Gracilariopsis chorda]|uniref:ATP-dependent DNA helicase MER3-like n=1 Tax=Gracilariopsis chorda TaxID=448386 RepID=A0A2V3J131_9FLOR|nr:ATP-dependent DNA helicase MER3-like [Gracilariopsis chorda]|eukprot:PXF48111.1 ATP-dependent DNA helicase MER3-like [Gracilariopsis chorda]
MATNAQNDAAEGIEVSSILPDYLRPAISFDKFNRMQSGCLETWNTDDNVLINAPTGTGKTVCFELAVLRHINKKLAGAPRKNLRSTGLGSKIVYIAPLKSLCSERFMEWREKFSFLGMNVELVSGDSTLADFEDTLSKTDLFVTTAEMWDTVTRGGIFEGSAANICSQVSLLLVDEVHQIGDKRGLVYESVVTRMLVTNRNASLSVGSNYDSNPVASLRVVAVSATIGNMHDVASWLNVPVSCIKRFDETYRPVSLQHHALGYTAPNPWLYGRVYEKQILRVVLQYGAGKPAIVFCTSRNQTVSSAQAVLAQIQDRTKTNRNRNTFTSFLYREQREKLETFSSRCDDALLQSLLPHGIAVHNADMSQSNRRIVEELFRESLILCLFSTSTLAQGVNLPARLVVIAGTTVYHEGRLQEYSRTKILQMCGRAGRNGLDTHGVAVVMTARSNLRLYANISAGEAEIVESQLSSHMECILNAEIARHLITDVPTAIHYLKSTFYWVKMSTSLSSEISEVSNEAIRVVENSIKKLAALNLIRYDEDLFGIESTIAGLCMAKHCISFETMRHLGERLPQAKSLSQVLRVISSSAELVDGVYVRRTEKKKLNEANQFLRMPVSGKVSEAVDKVFILLQIAISERHSVNGQNFSLKNEAQRLLRSASRVCNCVINLLLSQALRAPYATVVMALQVSRGLLNKCSWDGPTVFRQFSSLSPSHVPALWKRGVNSVCKLAALSTQDAADILGEHTNVMPRVRQKLRRLPKFTVEIESHAADKNRSEVLTITVDVASQLGNELSGKENSLHGFIIAGSVKQDLILCERFDLVECSQKRITFQMPVDSSSNCINVMVGCDNVVGVDWFGSHFASNVSKVLDRNKPMAKNFLNGRSHSAFRISVTAGRVSKKLSHSSLRHSEKMLAKFLEEKEVHHSVAKPLCTAPASDPQPRHPFRYSLSSVEEVLPSFSKGTEGKKRVASVYGTRCEGVALSVIPESAVCAQRVVLDPSATTCDASPKTSSIYSEGREYDSVFRSLF